MLAVAACSTDRDLDSLFSPEGVGTIVVQSTMVVGKNFPAIFLSRAAAPNEPFIVNNQLITNATVTITDENGIVTPYSNNAVGGTYWPRAARQVDPNATYFLRVETPEGEVVTAETTTPDAFSIDRWVLLDDTGTTVRRELRTYDELGDGVYDAPANQLIYSDGLLEAQFEGLPVPSYQVGIFSLDFDSDPVVDTEIFDEDDLDRFISSPPLESEFAGLRLPWFAIYFSERYKIRVYALDNNWFDFIRSVPDISGGPAFGGNVGDDFETPIFHVDGGIGLFGSASADSIGFFVLPRP